MFAAALVGSLAIFVAAGAAGTLLSIASIDFGLDPVPGAALIFLPILCLNGAAATAGVIHAACIVAWGERALPDRTALLYLLGGCVLAAVCSFHGIEPDHALADLLLIFLPGPTATWILGVLAFDFSRRRFAPDSQ